MVCHFPPLSYLVCGQSAEWAYSSTINEQTLTTNCCQMKIITLYITVFAQAAQSIQPTYLQHISTREPEHFVANISYIFPNSPPVLHVYSISSFSMCINIFTVSEEASNLGNFSLYSLPLTHRGFFIVCLGYMRVLQKTHLICDYQSNKHWSNNRHDVCYAAGDSHHYASIIWRQINVIHHETHKNSTVQSNSNCEQCHCCCGIFGVDEGQSKQSQTGAPVSCDQRVIVGYMFLKYAERLK